VSAALVEVVVVLLGSSLGLQMWGGVVSGCVFV
jgi:hypothetical protein